MTQTITLHGATPEINPLYIKMRRRFAAEGDRTIGEVKAQEAIRDGYQPYATPVRRQNPTERHVVRANSLPTPTEKDIRPVGRISLSGSSVAVVILCAFLLLVLVFSGLYINRLNGELNGLQNGVLNASSGLTLIAEDTDTLNAYEEDPVLTDNLLSVFAN